MAFFVIYSYLLIAVCVFLLGKIVYLKIKRAGKRYRYLEKPGTIYQTFKRFIKKYSD
jgi:hypothetical protein